jgi:transposase
MDKSRCLDDEIDFLIKLHFEDGLTYKQIGDMFGVSKSKIYSIFKKRGIKGKRWRIKPPPKEELEKLLANSPDGCVSVAKYYGVSKETVRLWAKKYGIKLHNWAYGKTVDSDERLRIRSLKMAQTMREKAKDPGFKAKLLARLKGGMKGKIHSVETRIKIGEAVRKAYREGRKKKVRISTKGKERNEKQHLKAILNVAGELKNNGYKVIPLHRFFPVPDLIASKNGKLYAVEVTDTISDIKPKYDGLDYDDIIWVIYSKRNGRLLKLQNIKQ